MGEQYYSIITNVGTEEFTKAIGEGKKVEIKEFAVGDGGGRESYGYRFCYAGTGR